MAEDHTLGDQPIEEKHRKAMENIAHAIDTVFNGDKRGQDRDVGFVLMVFPFGGSEGRCNYVSNADRRDVLTMLKEQVRRFEGQPEVEGNA